MIKLHEIKAELMEELKEIAEELRYMDQFTVTTDTFIIVSNLKNALINATDGIIENNIEKFNNEWQEFKYQTIDLEDAIIEGQNIIELKELDDLYKSLLSINIFEIDRLTNQPVIY